MPTYSTTYDGIALSNKVENFSNRDLYRKVIDNVLVATTFGSRVFSMGKSFSGKYKTFTVTHSRDSQFRWLGGGGEELSASAVNNTIELNYARTMGVQPKAMIDFEDFANDGDAGVIDLESFKYKEAAAVVTQELGDVIFDAGVGDQPEGLDSFADSGTLKTSIGGQSKTTYTVLRGTYTDALTVVTAAKISTLIDAVSASGSKEGSPTIGSTTKTVWSFIEELLTPFLQNQYQSNQMPKLPLRGLEVLAPGEFGARAVGIEIGPVQCALAWAAARLSGLRQEVRIEWGDFFKADLRPADVVFAYLTSAQADRLQKQLESQLRAGTRVVTISFDLPGWEPAAFDNESLIFLYQIPSR